MSESVEIVKPPERPEPQTEAAPRKPVELAARSARLEAHDVDLGGVLTLDELKLSATSLTIAPGPGGALRIGELN